MSNNGKFETVSFTGHRPQTVAGKEQWIMAALHVVTLRLIQQGTKKFISGGALGVDQWAAEVVLSHRDKFPYIQLVIARPFPSQDTMWTNDQKIAYANLCGQATNVIDICPEPCAPYKYHIRDRWMVDKCDLLVAVWNGLPKGGTASTVRFAQKVRKPILHIDPDREILDGYRFDRIARMA